MLVSVHLADVGVPAALSIARKPPLPGSIAGLRHANVGVAAPLSGSLLPKPQLGRAALVAFWDDDDAIDAFLADHPLARKLAGGWRVRLQPLRRYGSWPGLDDEITTARHVEHDGVVAAVTLGRPIASQFPRFVRTSAKAEGSVVGAPGLLWTTGIARPPSFVATCSLWESSQALATYAFGARDSAHPDAIAEGEAKPFHHEQAFVRFRPYGAQGHLEGRNPLAEALVPAV